MPAPHPPGRSATRSATRYDLAVVAAALAGACFGFLWWNAEPARIFMGDTGSLSLGGALAGLAIFTRTELLLVILGGLLVIEVMSVILQVGFFKMTRGRRLFKMSPIHHHFELLNWAQVTIVMRFWIIAGCASPRASASSTPSGWPALMSPGMVGTCR